MQLREKHPGQAKGRIAYFISPHGFGHAARACGVMAAIHEIDPSISFEIFTTVPDWFFKDSLCGPFTYRSLLTDIGLVQKTPLEEDLPKTLRCLDDFLPYDPSKIRGLAEYLNKIACVLVICDIAPMGIAVAEAADIPSVLVENFTWDWIYQNYASYHARMGKYINYLQDLFGTADYHIQTEPICRYHNADLSTLPVSRRARTPSKETRSKLGIPDGAEAVLVTMGGMQHRYTFSEQLINLRDVYFIIPGGSQSMQLRENLVLLPHHSDFFHPDLINACSAVIGKVGYSTVAEAYYAGISYGYVTRPSFPESDVLAAYIEREMNGFPISETEFQEVFWISQLTEFLSLPLIERSSSNGAVQAAQFIYRLLKGKIRQCLTFLYLLYDQLFDILPVGFLIQAGRMPHCHYCH